MRKLTPFPIRFAHLIVVSSFALVLGSSAQAEITVQADFPGASGAVEVIDQENAVVRINPTNYPGRGWRCWWYVKLEGLSPDQELTLDVGEAPWATPDRATFSVDGGRTWRHSAEGEREGKRIRYSFRFGTRTALVAWGPPFIPQDALQLVERIAQESPDADGFLLCHTRENRDTPALRVTAAGTDIPRVKRPLIWVQARQHAWESGSSWVAKGFAEWIVSDSPEAIRLRGSCEVVVVPIMDIDNVYRGAGGKAQKPRDHNRDWNEAPHWHAVAAAQKELRAAAEASRLAAFVDLHNPGANEHVPFFYVSSDEVHSASGQKNLQAFLELSKVEITGPLQFRGRTVVAGKQYDPKAWTTISKNWVAGLGTPAVAVTLEIPWNTPDSTTDGYETVGEQRGKALARYCDAVSLQRLSGHHE